MYTKRKRKRKHSQELTVLQNQMLQLIADGMDYRMVAEVLGKKPVNMRSSFSLIYDKLGASHRGHAVAIGFRRHLIK